MKAKLLANRHRALIVEPDPERVGTVLELRDGGAGLRREDRPVAPTRASLLGRDGAEFDRGLRGGAPRRPTASRSSPRRARSGGGARLAWVVHTRKQGRSEAQRAFDLGALDFVAKPVQADVLVAKIKAMLQQRSQTPRQGRRRQGRQR